MSDDFSPEVRSSAVWSGDARRIMTGRAGEVYAEKIGVKPLADLSAVEHVQMGLVMQEPIMREYARRNGIAFKDADYSIRHQKHDFLASHFDYISEDGQTLYEVKNLGAHQRNKYGEAGSGIVDAGYFVQCLHESLVHGIRDVVLVVCFGGQEIAGYPLSFADEQWDEHAQLMAKFWAQVQARNPDALDLRDAAAVIYPRDDGSTRVADGRVEEITQTIAVLRKQIKALEEDEEKYVNVLRAYIGEASTLMSVSGQVLATWKTAKPSEAFDRELFARAMPDIYQQFVVERPGSRRLIVK